MIGRCFSVFVCLFLLSACASHYRRSADKEVAGIIKDKSPGVRNMDAHFTLSTTNGIIVTNLEVFDQEEEAFGLEKEMERGAQVLTLAHALDLAVRGSGDYLTQKENLYIQALDLTYQRYLYSPIFSGNLSVVSEHRRLNAVDANNIDRIIDSHDVRFTGRLSFQSLLRTGGKLTADFTTDFLRFVGGPGAWVKDNNIANSALSADLFQPLLRGAGYVVAMEQLTQAERNFLYALRSFTSYRKNFSVNIASQYYGVLQDRDTVRNYWRKLQNLRQNVIREEANFKEDRSTQANVDQIKQSELQAESDWIGSVRKYRTDLDQFKVTIGLRSDARVILDDRELEALKIIPTEIGIDEAVNVAMVNRLDLDNQRDQLADSARHVKVNANALLPQLDFNASVNVARSDNTFLPEPDWKRYGWSAGLSLDLPINRVSERNNYRSSLILLDRAKRNFNIAIDNIKVQIADDWRNLDLTRRTYEISDQSVNINTRRVEEQQLRQVLGLTTMRDIIDAQNDLTGSKNARTAALINHALTRVGFFRDMGVLWIMDDGQWDENKTASLVKNETKNH